MPSSGTLYRGYHIEFRPVPIPWRGADWHFSHESYDGPGDTRCGTASTLADAKAAIDDVEDG